MLAAFAFALSLLASAPADAGVDAGAAPDAGGVAVGGPLSELAAYEALWTRRDDPQAIAELNRLAAVYAASDDPQKLWRASRWYLWISEDDTDKRRQHTNSDLGVRAGEKGARIDPHCIPCGYWGALNVGVYALGISVFTALIEGIEGKFRKPIEAAAASDPKHQNPDLDYVGPQKSLGRYYYKLPWPKRSLKKSRELLEVAVATRPDDLRARCFLAETLITIGDNQSARAQLSAIFNAPPGFDPAEATRVMADAQALAAKVGLKTSK